MWILPKQLYQSPLEYVDLNEVLSGRAYGLDLPLMWRSKPSRLQTWLQRWNRVPWVQLLFGRILNPSMAHRFVEKYTASLPVIHANHSAHPEIGQGLAIHDTFSQTYFELSRQLDLFGAFSKTSRGTLAWDSTKFTKAYEKWAIELRQVYLARLKSGHHTSENAYSYLLSTWPTPQLPKSRNSFNEIFRNTPGLEAVVLWPTPTVYAGGEDIDKHQARAQRMKLRHKNGNGVGMNLATAVQLWPTPTASEQEKAAMNSHQQSLTSLALNGQLVGVRNNTIGKSRERLNPAWVAQLMGTSIESIYYVHLATQLLNKPQL